MFLPPMGVANVNWVGYSWASSTKAAAQFVVPDFPYHKMSASEKNNQNGLALWAGLGTGPIEQIGIYDYVQAGKVNWAGLYEFYPNPPVSTGHGISTGDTMFLNVSRSGYTYTLVMRDAGPHNKWTVTIKKNFGHIENTAEFMAEDYTYTTAHPPLTYFTPVKAAVSAPPTTEWFTAWGHAKRIAAKVIEIFG